MNQNVITGANGRSFAVVIQNTVTMTFDLQQIKAQISYLVSQMMQQNKMWISRFILVTFNGAAAQSQVFSSSANFINAINLTSINFAPGNCSKKIVLAVQTALQSTLPYGYVYVFTDSTASDYMATGSVFGQLESTKAAVSFVVSNLSPCGSQFQTPGAQVMVNLATFSDGQLFAITKPLVTQIIRYIPTLYQSGLTYTSGSQNCSSPQTHYFPIESHAYSFTVSSAGVSPNVTLYDPTGKMYNAAPMVTGQYITVLHVWKRNGTIQQNMIPGTWTAVVQANGGCNIQVRVQSNIQLYYGFSLNIHNDFPFKEPISANGYHNYMLAHMTNVPKGTLEYMNMFNINGSLVGSALFSKRGNCSYEYLSQSITCPNVPFGVVVSGYDELGFLYNRIRVAYCISACKTKLYMYIAKQPIHLAQECQNGGIVYQGACVCTSLWTGYLCQTARCLNGGTNQGSTCICPIGFSGVHCEISEIIASQRMVGNAINDHF